ncbi:MAG: hypothetical protein AB4352_18770 [Hormoscilla sp.]
MAIARYKYLGVARGMIGGQWSVVSGQWSQVINNGLPSKRGKGGSGREIIGVEVQRHRKIYW